MMVVMVMESKTFSEEYIYKGLGFPICIRNPQFSKVRGELVFKVDIEKISKIAFKLLAIKPSRLTGDEIKFVRIYLNLSRTAFGGIFKLSHTAVSKWEKVGEEFAPISPSQEIVLRLSMIDRLDITGKDFYIHFKQVEQSVFNSSEELIQVAV